MLTNTIKKNPSTDHLIHYCEENQRKKGKKSPNAQAKHSFIFQTTLQTFQSLQHARDGAKVEINQLLKGARAKFKYESVFQLNLLP